MPQTFVLCGRQISFSRFARPHSASLGEPPSHRTYHSVASALLHQSLALQSVLVRIGSGHTPADRMQACAFLHTARYWQVLLDVFGTP